VKVLLLPETELADQEAILQEPFKKTTKLEQMLWMVNLNHII
jgi:hypothetical protein